MQETMFFPCKKQCFSNARNNVFQMQETMEIYKDSWSWTFHIEKFFTAEKMSAHWNLRFLNLKCLPILMWRKNKACLRESSLCTATSLTKWDLYRVMQKKCLMIKLVRLGKRGLKLKKKNVRFTFIRIFTLGVQIVHQYFMRWRCFFNCRVCDIASQGISNSGMWFVFAEVSKKREKSRES